MLINELKNAKIIDSPFLSLMDFVSGRHVLKVQQAILRVENRFDLVRVTGSNNESTTIFNSIK